MLKCVWGKSVSQTQQKTDLPQLMMELHPDKPIVS